MRAEAHVSALAQCFVERTGWHRRLRKRCLRYGPERLQGVGIITAQEAIALGATGPILRSTGVAWDLRRDQPYLKYDEVDFDVIVGTYGDNFDRYALRVEDYLNFFPFYLGYALSRRVDMPGVELLDEQAVIATNTSSISVTVSCV